MGFNYNMAEALKDDPKLPPGIYHAEVSKAEEKRSNNTGDGMIVVSLVALDHGKKALTRDFIMCEGKARGMGTKKLMALGLPMREDTFVLEASMLLGKRAYVRVMEEEFTNSKGVTSKTLKIAGEKDDGSSFGYWSDDAPPAAYEKADDDDGDPMGDVPF